MHFDDIISTVHQIDIDALSTSKGVAWLTNKRRLTITLNADEEAAIEALKKTKDFAKRPLSRVVRYLIDEGMIRTGLKVEDDA